MVFRGNLERLVDPVDRPHARLALNALIHHRTVPDPPATLGGRARRLLAAAASEERLPPAEARWLLQPLSEDLAALSPSRLETAPVAPVFLLHGSNDPIVPAADAEKLAEALRARGTPVEVLVTDAFEHVDATRGATPSLFDVWPVLRFMADALDAAGL